MPIFILHKEKEILECTTISSFCDDAFAKRNQTCARIFLKCEINNLLNYVVHKRAEISVGNVPTVH